MRKTLLALAAAILLPLTACVAGWPFEAEETIRHDMEPLVKRFPALSDAKSATWTSGYVTDPPVPGPNLLWIEGVVELDEQTWNETLALEGAQTQDPTTVLSSRITREYNADDVYVTSEALVEYFKKPYEPGSANNIWDIDPFISMSEPVLVFYAMGG